MSAVPPDAPVSRMVDVLLATYNGADFVAEQIVSLLRQTYQNSRILARDDGSADRTVDILRQYAAQYPNRIVLVDDRDGNLGYVGNFARLMERSTADYLAFCDQDDVWLPEKLALCMERMRDLELDHGTTKPLLVHTDLRAVDQTLQTISTSFWRYQRVSPGDANDLGRLIVHNVVTGCTMLMNRSLKELSLPIPAEARVHDWWIALVAAAFGSVGDISTPTVLYRQHGKNAIGSKPLGGWRIWPAGLEFLRTLPARREHLSDTWRQAQAFLERFADRLNPHHVGVLNDVLDLPFARLPARLLTALNRGRLPPEGLYWMAFALFLPRRVQADAQSKRPVGKDNKKDPELPSNSFVR